MKSKKDLIPIALASIIALVITCLVRFLIPVNSAPVKEVKEEVPMPDIPLMAKDKTKKKSIEVFVLVVSKDIKKDEKISTNNCDWKKWPGDDMQPYFIAKNKDNVPLNNGADYSNAMRMWAKTDIPSGIPLLIRMLDAEDPVKKAEAERKRKEQEEKEKKRREEEEKKKREEEERAKAIKKTIIEKGMRAVTFVVDQKSSVSTVMLVPGDLIDVLIMERKGDRVKTHKYKALKVFAIDGSIAGSRQKNGEKRNDGFLDNITQTVQHTIGQTIKNVTLEIKENMVETMINQASSSGIIISVRSQDEEVDKSELNKDILEESNDGDSSIINDILDVTRRSSTEKLLEKKAQEDDKSQNAEMLMNDILDVTRQSSTEKLLEKKAQEDDKSQNAEVLMNDILDVNRQSSTEKLLEKKAQEDDKSQNAEVLMNDILDVNRQSSTEKLLEKKAQEDDKSQNAEVLMNDILDVNRQSSTEKLLEKKAQEDDKSQNAEMLMNDILDVNRQSSTEKLIETRERHEADSNNAELLIDNMNAVAGFPSNKIVESLERSSSNTKNGNGNYEIVSGKVLGDEAKNGEEKRVMIYKKLTPQEVKFDKDGNVSDGTSASASAGTATEDI
ncbi:hypothetical protein FACS189449_04740 [Alphaproteobacteria bacterium]|nr:hypothetical protein FACS189449_04740 [Alphaproteobacteria bacterium]